MRTRFQMALEQLKQKLLTMGGLAEQAIDRAIEAYRRRDEKLCLAVLEGEKAINSIEREIDELALDLLAQAGVGAPVEPSRHPAQGARQQHRRLVAALVAQSEAEAAARALPQQYDQVALLDAVPHALEQPGGVQPAHALVQRPA